MEAYASASSVVKRTEEALRRRARKLARRAASPAAKTLSALMIDEEAERGDALALEIVLETARYLGIGMVTAMHAIDPQGVVIGGAMTFGRHETATGRKFLARSQAGGRAAGVSVARRANHDRLRLARRRRRLYRRRRIGPAGPLAERPSRKQY